MRNVFGWIACKVFCSVVASVADNDLRRQWCVYFKWVKSYLNIWSKWIIVDCFVIWLVLIITCQAFWHFSILNDWKDNRCVYVKFCSLYYVGLYGSMALWLYNCVRNVCYWVSSGNMSFGSSLIMIPMNRFVQSESEPVAFEALLYLELSLFTCGKSIFTKEN